MTTALTTITETTRLATIASRYVQETPAPEPASLMLLPGHRRIEIQPPANLGKPVTALNELLTWTHGLTDITGDCWHTNAGDLHITLIGHGPHGVAFRIYTGIPYRVVRRYVHLAKNASEPVTPDQLRWLALQLRKGQTK